MLAMYNLHRNWQSETNLLRTTLVATQNDRVVGVGTIFESTFHPAMLMVIIHVATTWQRQSIGTLLFNALQQVSDGRPWLVKLTRRDEAGVQFFHTQGFRPIVDTLTGVLNLQEPRVQEWVKTLPKTHAEYNILNMDEPECSVSLTDIALVQAAVYRQFHTWSPPIEESVAQALHHYCGTNVMPGSHFCAYDNTQLIGANNLITNPFRPEANEGYLMNVGVIQVPHRDADTLAAMLIRHTLEFATTRNMPVRFEADSTYTPHRTLFENAPATDVDDSFIIMSNQNMP
ncbi:MAG: GNAT family N-acetyltransferase [Chloroflexota bacterium]